MQFLVNNQLTDNQWALIGCGAAIVLCMSIVSLGNFLGKANRSDRSKSLNAGLPTDQPEISTNTTTESQSSRKAA